MEQSESEQQDRNQERENEFHNQPFGLGRIESAERRYRGNL